jgi:UDP-N-acetyl-D-mannosaminuronic acid transferase (WecB/TagA/CpsF family)
MANIKIIEAGGVHADGVQIGQTGEKLAFLGSTPVVQRVGAAQAAVAATAATSTTPFGYAEAQANAIVTLLNEIRAALIAVGIIKGSA